jgi:hypothetical protein
MTMHTPIATPSEIERLLFHMGAVAAQATNEWSTGFAQSILRQRNRKNWKPSDKQVALMRRLVSDLFTYRAEIGEDFDLIES